MIYTRNKNCSFWKYELKPSEHDCKVFFNYSKLSVISFPTKKIHFLLSNGFQTNPRNVTGKNPLMVIPLLANQDLMPMLTDNDIGIHTGKKHTGKNIQTQNANTQAHTETHVQQ